MITGKYPNLRLRRNRKTDWSRRLIEESTKLNLKSAVLSFAPHPRIFFNKVKNIK